MTQTAAIITVAYTIAVVLGSLVAVAVWRSTKRAGEGPEESEVVGYGRREGAWLIAVLLGLFALLLVTIFYVPYGQSAGDESQRVEVVGRQFSWDVTPSSLRAGIPVEFFIETGDVNHGFGVYDDDGVLQFQAQVIPDRVQRVVHTFDRPGTYTILCLEFCGAAHHLMEETFEVRS